jgi:hypothetical protein
MCRSNLDIGHTKTGIKSHITNLFYGFQARQKQSNFQSCFIYDDCRFHNCLSY